MTAIAIDTRAATPYLPDHKPHGAAAKRKNEMEVGVLAAFILLFSLVGLGLLIVALVDLVKRPADVWNRSGHNQIVWALIVVFVGFIGPMLYLLIARPALESAPIADASALSGR